MRNVRRIKSPSNRSKLSHAHDNQHVPCARVSYASAVHASKGGAGSFQKWFVGKTKCQKLKNNDLFFPPPRPFPSPSHRTNIKAALASVPAQYHVIEHEVGAVAFLGEGTPLADAGAPVHSPQILARPECIVILVSPSLDAADVADAFVNVCEAHEDPKSRAVGLKMKLRELGVNARFSFVLLDLVNTRVFAASTALSSPLAVGHACDGAF